MTCGVHQLACVALLLAACGSNSRVAGGGAARPEQRTDPLRGELDLARDLEATVLEDYMQLTLGNLDAFADGVARDRDVVLLGISADDVVAGREPKGMRDDRRPFAKRGVKLLARNLDVNLSDDASVGWVYDEMSYRVAYDGRSVSIPLRFTGVFVRDIDRWVMVQEHLAYALPIEQIITLARAGKLKTPKRVCRKKECGGVAKRYLRSVVETLHTADRDAERHDVLASDPRALLLWPGPDDEYVGDAVTGAPRLAERFGDRATVEVVATRAAVSRSDKVAWVTANLAVHTGDDDDLVIGMRGTYVLELVRVGTNKYRWKVVQAHVSVPVELSELSQRVFGGAK